MRVFGFGKVCSQALGSYRHGKNGAGEHWGWGLDWSTIKSSYLSPLCRRAAAGLEAD
jgi:hypothetical protein